MRCYNGCIPESDYRARYGYTQREYEDLKKENPEILITYFPQEGLYSACLPSEKYRELGKMVPDRMDCLQRAIEIRKEESR